MSVKWFDAITTALCFMDVDKPTYRDKFWKVQQIIAESNKNMTDAFSPGGIICLDKLMSMGHSHWTCPGWVFCPCKPTHLVMNTTQLVVV